MRDGRPTDAAPKAIGPYSQAIRAGGFLLRVRPDPAGPATGQMVEGGIEAQTRQVMDNLAAVLAAAGASMADVVRTTIYLADLADFATVNEIYGRCFEPPAPGAGDGPGGRGCRATRASRSTPSPTWRKR